MIESGREVCFSFLRFVFEVRHFNNKQVEALSRPYLEPSQLRREDKIQKLGDNEVAVEFRARACYVLLSA